MICTPKKMRPPKVLATCLAALLLLLGQGCATPPEELSWSGPDQPMMVQDSITLPRFNHAQDQLNYARSGLSDPKEKLAAFRAVLALFPLDRTACAQAAMGLAYLHLEPEYRFAADLSIRQAINEFERVLADYGDLPDARAKTLWYLGWIHTDLKQDPQTGLPFYWQVVRELPQVPMQLFPTVPWVNLVFAQESSPKALYPSQPQVFWAEVALLEIVRNSRNSTEILSAFDGLMDHYGSGQTAGLAIKFLLALPHLAHQVLPHAAVFLDRFEANPYLVREIQDLAQVKVP